jgi:hypothetical protein
MKARIERELISCGCWWVEKNPKIRSCGVDGIDGFRRRVGKRIAGASHVGKKEKTVRTMD